MEKFPGLSCYVASERYMGRHQHSLSHHGYVAVTSRPLLEVQLWYRPCRMVVATAGDG